jgi:hypothetical protein
MVRSELAIYPIAAIVSCRVPVLLLNSVFCLLDTAMRPNLRSNRNQTPLKLVDANPAPAQPEKHKKRSKKKPTRRKAPITAPTAAEEVVDAAKQLVAL